MLLVCPETGVSLEREAVYVDHEEFRIENIYKEKNGDKFYAELDGVVYLMKKFSSLEALKDLKYANIVSVVNEQSVRWYRDYKEKFAKFKYAKFIELYNGYNTQNEANILDFISSDGNLIDTFKIETTNSFKANYYALDLDFASLTNLKTKYPDVTCICADATKKCFESGQFDMIFSNSLHHVPYHFEETARHLIDYLKTGSYFYGVESQGILAKIIIYAISLLPKPIIPYFLSEIHNERNLFKEWLRHSIKYKCRRIPEYQRINRKPFHEFYSFLKS